MTLRISFNEAKVKLVFFFTNMHSFKVFRLQILDGMELMPTSVKYMGLILVIKIS